MMRVFIVLITLWLFLSSACSPASTEAPESRDIATPTIRPTAVPQPTNYPTPAWQPITPENAADIVEIARPHLRPVQQSFWTPDGQYLLLTGTAGVSIYDGGTYALVGFMDADNRVAGSAISPDGNLLVLSTIGGVLEFWDMGSFERTDVLSADPLNWCYGSSGNISFNSSGKLLAIEALTLHEDCTLIWDVELRGALYGMPGHTKPVFSPTESNLLATYYRQNIYMRGAYDGEVLYYLPGEGNYEFSPDGNLFLAQDVVSNQEDGRFNLWEVENGVLRHVFPSDDGYFERAHFIRWKDDIAVIVFRDDGHKDFWDPHTGTAIESLNTEIGVGRSVFAISADRNWIAVRSGEPLQLWHTGSLDGNLATILPIDHSKWVSNVSFHPSGNQLLVTYDNASPEVWDVTTKTLQASIKSHIWAAYFMSFSPDGDMLLTVQNDQVFLRNAYTGEVRLQINSSSYLASKAFSLTSKNQVLVPGEDFNNLREASLTSWDPKTGDLIEAYVLEGKPDMHWTREFLFSPDENWLVSEQLDGVWIWEVSTGQRVAVLEYGSDTRTAKDIAFSSDGNHIMGLLGNDTLVTWQMGAWEQMDSLAVPGDTKMFSPSPAGNLIAVALARAGKVQVWDQAAGQWAGECQSQVIKAWGISDLAFSPDGRLLAIVHSNQVSLCDMASYKIIHSTTPQADWIPHVLFHPDGLFFVTLSGDETMRYWGIP